MYLATHGPMNDNRIHGISSIVADAASQACIRTRDVIYSSQACVGIVSQMSIVHLNNTYARLAGLFSCHVQMNALLRTQFKPVSAMGHTMELGLQLRKDENDRVSIRPAYTPPRDASACTCTDAHARTVRIRAPMYTYDRHAWKYASSRRSIH